MDKFIDTIVLGSGPAGLQLGYYLEKNNEDYLILEKNEISGSFFSVFPRHRTLISINKVHTGFSDPELNLRWDWNSFLTDENEFVFRDYDSKYFPDADSIVSYMNDFQEKYSIQVEYSCVIEKVSRVEGKYSLITSTGKRFLCNKLIVATGFNKQNIPNIPGIEHGELYTDYLVDKNQYIGKRVMIIGKGNSAFETADSLVDVTSSLHIVSPNPVKLAWQSHYVGNLRAVNCNILDTYQLKSQNTIIDGDILNIEKNNDGLMVEIKYSHADGQRIRIPVDNIIVCAGFKFDHSIFEKNCCPELTISDKFPKLTSEWESVNQEHMYFAGTLMHSRDYKKHFSGFIHGFRYNISVLFNILNYKYNRVEIPSWKVDRNLVKKILERIHNTSILFQQPGFMGDVLSFESTSKTISYFEGLPLDYLNDGRLAPKPSQYLVLTMEYDNQCHPDPFNIKRQPNDENVISAFIHPVFRYYRENRLITEFHLPEDLENNWYQDIYVKSLCNFLCNEVGLLLNINDIDLQPTIDGYQRTTQILPSIEADVYDESKMANG